MTHEGTEAPYRLMALDHVVVRVRDMATMTRFYVRALGCELAWERPELGLVHLRAGAAMIDLLDAGGPLGGDAPAGPGRNMDHICLTVSPFDEAALKAHLASWGQSTGAAAERFGATGKGLSLYTSDPEGNRIELKAAG
jgi:glyoxylase I family protein